VIEVFNDHVELFEPETKIERSKLLINPYTGRITLFNTLGAMAFKSGELPGHNSFLTP